MSDQDIIRAASRRWQSRQDITDGQARVIASQWHGGQTSALCVLATSGAITDGAMAEVNSAVRDAEQRLAAGTVSCSTSRQCPASTLVRSPC
jgi:hypothetical protein